MPLSCTVWTMFRHLSQASSTGFCFLTLPESKSGGERRLFLSGLLRHEESSPCDEEPSSRLYLVSQHEPAI